MKIFAIPAMLAMLVGVILGWLTPNRSVNEGPRLVTPNSDLWASSALLIPQDPQEEDRQSNRDFMRTKLMYTQNIMEGLSIRRFDLIESASDEIIRITSAEGWLPQKEPELIRASDELKKAAEHLKKAAQSENLEAATLRYFELTLKCIDCHQMLRKADF